MTYFLLLSGCLFIFKSFEKYTTDGTWDEYLSYGLLGSLVLCPGIYYSIMITLIVFGVEGYEYSDLPDLSNNS